MLGSLHKGETQARHGRSRTRTSLIVSQYKQLSAEDVEALAPVFSDAPQYDSDAMIDYEVQTRQLISALPSHLKNVHPWLSSACGMHKYLNTLLIDDLWQTILKEINHEIKEVWQPLDKQDRLSPAQQYYFEHLHSKWYTPYKKCSGQNNDLLTVTGAITQATLSSRNWKRSKRLYFLECLMRGRVARHHADGAVRKMFDLGVQLRTLREDFSAAQTNRREIDEAVLKYETGRSGHVQGPQAEVVQAPRHQSHTAQVSNALSTFFNPEDVPVASTVEPPPAPPVPSTVQRKPVPQRPATRPGTFTVPPWPAISTMPPTPGPQSVRRAPRRDLPAKAGLAISQDTRGVSSTYSQGSDGDWEDFASDNEDVPSPRTPRPAARNTEIIEMYRYPPANPAEAGPTSPPFVARPSTPHPEAARRLKPRSSQPKLAPIWVPRDRYGDKNDQDPPKTSVLWKRRMSAMESDSADGSEGRDPSKSSKGVRLPAHAANDFGRDSLYCSDRWI